MVSCKWLPVHGMLQASSNAPAGPGHLLPTYRLWLAEPWYGSFEYRILQLYCRLILTSLLIAGATLALRFCFLAGMRESIRG